jgi:hypothetical protein
MLQFNWIVRGGLLSPAKLLLLLAIRIEALRRFKEVALARAAPQVRPEVVCAGPDHSLSSAYANP